MESHPGGSDRALLKPKVGVTLRPVKATLLSAFAGLALAVGASAASNPSTLAPGSQAPDFDLPGVDGRNWKLSDFSDAQLLVVVFTCNHCPTAQYYEDRLKQLVNDYRPKGVAFVAISPNDPEAVRLDELGYALHGDSFEEMKVHARLMEFNFPYLYGGGEYEQVSRAYGPVATPHTFIFDAERKLRYSGRIDDSEREKFVRQRDVRNVLDALLAGEEPPVTQTRVFGCSVKWSNAKEGVAKYWERIAAEPVTVEPVDAEGLRSLRINESAKNDQAKLRLVNFWATWCGPCVIEFPELMTINRMYRQRDFELVTVAAHYPDEREQVLRFLKKQQASNRNLIFGDTDKHKLIEAFDAEWSGALPFTVLIDPAGEILYRKEGMIDPMELRQLILRELNARKPW
jgi:thiol-disulfide isomerase/thioredoxin